METERSCRGKSGLYGGCLFPCQSSRWSPALTCGMGHCFAETATAALLRPFFLIFSLNRFKTTRKYSTLTVWPRGTYSVRMSPCEPKKGMTITSSCGQLILEFLGQGDSFMLSLSTLTFALRVVDEHSTLITSCYVTQEA